MSAPYRLFSSALLATSLTFAAVFPALARRGAKDLGKSHSQTASLFAQASESISLPGLHEPVEVLRDRWGVPHIYAKNQHDLFFAQGFVAARDRLFQMELWKRAGQGRLAEIVGPSALPRDIAARLLRYRGSMKAEYLSYAPDTRAILTAFTDGINAYIGRATAPGGPGLPIEFKLAGFTPEPWKPEDCLTRMATLSVTGNATAELAFAHLVDLLGPKKATLLAQFDPATRLAPAPGEDLRSLSPELIPGFVGTDAHIVFPPGIKGSNNWTISGKLTLSGKPLLANDPHRTIALPSLRYIVHLVAPGWDVIGATEPALPGVSIGHNEDIAWGLTVFPVDQEDLFLERLNPKNLLQYRTPGGWAKMRVVDETFRIRGAKPVTMPLKFTRHGPVLWAAGTRALALRWVGAEPGTAPYLAGISVDRAHDWRQYLRAMARWKTPPENLVYADRRGNIGVQSAGLVPIRPKGNGLLPAPGTGGYEWNGFIPLSRLPREFNPARGYSATANNKTISPHYPYAVGFSWSRDRIARIRQVLDAARAQKERLGMDDMARLQNDVVSLPAQELVKLLATIQANDPPAKLLRGWNGALTADSAAAALYEVWLGKLQAAVVAMLLPKQPDARLPLYGDSLARLLAHPPAALFGPRPDTRRAQILRQTLSAAYVEMQNLEGRDPATWSWGRLHKSRFHHSLDQLPGLASFLDLGPVPRPGDGTTINATPYRSNNYEQVAGASYREIFDLSDWDKSEAINVPGESGRPGSPHYADLLPLWRDGQYFPLVYSHQAVEKEATEKLELVPAGQSR
jgi:penicillin amidase